MQRKSQTIELVIRKCNKKSLAFEMLTRNEAFHFFDFQLVARSEIE